MNKRILSFLLLSSISGMLHAEQNTSTEKAHLKVNAYLHDRKVRYALATAIKMKNGMENPFTSHDSAYDDARIPHSKCESAYKEFMKIEIVDEENQLNGLNRLKLNMDQLAQCVGWYKKSLSFLQEKETWSSFFSFSSSQDEDVKYNKDDKQRAKRRLEQSESDIVLCKAAIKADEDAMQQSEQEK